MSDATRERARLAAILRRQGNLWRGRGRADLASALTVLAEGVARCDDDGEPPQVLVCASGCASAPPGPDGACAFCGGPGTLVPEQL